MADSLTKTVWIEKLSFLQEILENKKKANSISINNKLIPVYAILANLFDDKDLQLRSEEKIENLAIINKLIAYRTIVSKLSANKKFERQMFHYFDKIFEIIENIINQSAKYQEADNSYTTDFIDFLEDVFRFEMEAFYEKTINIISKLIQQLPKQDQIISYYHLTDFLIDLNLLQNNENIKIFQIAEEMYNSNYNAVGDINNYPINQIKLEQAFKSNNLNIIVKLFHYFFKPEEIYNANNELFTILDYLHENGHEKIFSDFLNIIVDRFKLKEEAHLWAPHEKDFLTKFFGILFIYSTKWNTNEILAPIKEIFNYSTDIELYWDVRLEIAKKEFGFLTIDELNKEITSIATNYMNAFDALDWEEIISKGESGTFKNREFNILKLKITNIYTETPKLGIYDYFREIKNILFQNFAKIILKFTEKNTHSEFTLSEILIILFGDLNIEELLLELTLESNNIDSDLIIRTIEEITKLKTKNEIITPFLIQNKKIVEYFNQSSEYDIIVNLLSKIKVKKEKETIHELINNIDRYFETNKIPPEEKTFALLERPVNIFPNQEVNLPDSINESEIKKAINLRLFLVYCFFLIKSDYFENSSSFKKQVTVKELLPNYLKL